MRGLQTFVLLLSVGFTVIVAAQGGEDTAWPGLRERLMSCEGPGDYVPLESLSDFAKNQGKSKADLAEKLVEIVTNGLEDSSDGAMTGLTKSALWGLSEVGGEKENSFVREIMRSHEGYWRAVAIPVGIRMIPEKWEEWVREIASDKRYNDQDRFLAYREAFLIGKAGDEDTRKRVVEVLKESRFSDSRQINRNHLGLWITELEGTGWEEWMRKVATEDCFYNADRYWAYELAFRVGMAGDEKTREHVIDVLLEMRDRDTSHRNRNELDRWIEELKAR